MNFGLCDGDVYILLITLLPNGMGDDGVGKEVRKLPEHRGKTWQQGTWVIMG